jgi:hypothetical protein
MTDVHEAVDCHEQHSPAEIGTVPGPASLLKPWNRASVVRTQLYGQVKLYRSLQTLNATQDLTQREPHGNLLTICGDWHQVSKLRAAMLGVENSR